MLKMMVQAHRKQGMGDADFYARWQEAHGRLVRQVAHDIGWRRYVQAHRIDSPDVAAVAAARGWRPPSSDGLAELWWDDRAAMEAALASPEGQRASELLERDEQAFTDTSKLSALLAVQTTLYGTPPARPRPDHAVKMVIEVHRSPSLSESQFREQWQQNYAPLVGRVGGALGISAYLANHVDLDNPLDFAVERGWRSAPDVVAELWWASTAAMAAALRAPAAREAGAELARVEAEIFNAADTSAYLAVERCIFDEIATP